MFLETIQTKLKKTGKHLLIVSACPEKPIKKAFNISTSKRVDGNFTYFVFF